jgi:predicted short-subunit dehydrogenase-like oxidoreductase (DUF2520 family)
VTLARSLAEKGHAVTLRARRRALPRTVIDADVLVLATRDGDVGALATELASRRLVSKRTVVVHVAGALDAEVLAPLRGVAAGIGQAHPLLSFASPAAPPALRGAHVLVSGDSIAVRRASRLFRALDMVPRAWSVDRALYHAAAGLVANGAAALAQAGATLLVRAGAPERDVARALAPLLRSVADNVARVGLPAALTGPVRRGDAVTVGRHLDAMGVAAPDVVPLYVESARAQLGMARALGDAPGAAFDAVAARLDATKVRRTDKKTSRRP